MNYAIARRRMVDQQLRNKGIEDSLVLAAMEQIPRHLFVEEAFQSQAYGDFPLPIGERQTISQPFMVGLMTASLQLQGGERVLEVGTGSGYQAAVLSRIAGRVYTVERLVALARRARKVLDQVGCPNVQLKVSDGSLGWYEEAPFDAIMVTAGSPAIPGGYLTQLAKGGRLVIPVGDRATQVLKRLTYQGDGKFLEEQLVDCRFVPLVGAEGWNLEGEKR